MCYLGIAVMMHSYHGITLSSVIARDNRMRDLLSEAGIPHKESVLLFRCNLCCPGEIL